MEFRSEPRPSDAGAIRAIVASSGYFSESEIAVAVELLEERLTSGESSGYHFLFAEEEGRVAGYTCFGPIPCTAASFDLYWIAVHETMRSRGLGRQLLERTERAIAAMGGARVYIETSGRAQYEPTRRFYLRCAYQQDALLEDFYAPGDPKVVYLKALSIRPRPESG